LHWHLLLKRNQWRKVADYVYTYIDQHNRKNCNSPIGL